MSDLNKIDGLGICFEHQWEALQLSRKSCWPHGSLDKIRKECKVKKYLTVKKRSLKSIALAVQQHKNKVPEKQWREVKKWN